MKTLLTVQTPSWDLSIKSNQTDSRLNQLKQVMETRDKPLPKSSVKLSVQRTGKFKLSIDGGVLPRFYGHIHKEA